MDFLRKIVSGPKNRYEKDGYNLDLTYITDRIIGMSFPAEGFEKLYRNSLNEVAKFIKKEHKNNYLIFNLSCRSYNYEKFGGQEKIKSYQWEDHHSPPLHMLFDICQEMHNFLNQDPENVCIVHCKAGKGRTGTIICCYFLYCNMFNNPQDALYYYGKKRFIQDGLGVNQPCQKRYVEDYFWKILQVKVNNLKKIYPKVKIIDSVTIFGRPKTSDEVKPYVNVIDVHTQKQIMTTKKNNKDQIKFESNENSFKIKFDDKILEQQNKGIHGDILIKIYDNCKWSKDNKLGRMAINSAFIDSNNTLLFVPEQISPSQFKDDKKFPSNYRIQIKFKDLCEDTIYTPFDEQCEACISAWSLDKQGKENWEDMYKILENYKQPTKEEAQKLLFKSQENFDVEAVLKEKNNEQFETTKKRSQNKNDKDLSSKVEEQMLFESIKQEKSIDSQGNDSSFYIMEDFQNNNNYKNQNQTRLKSKTFVISKELDDNQKLNKQNSQNDKFQLIHKSQLPQYFQQGIEDQQDKQDCQKANGTKNNNNLNVETSPQNLKSDQSEFEKDNFMNTSEGIRKRTTPGHEIMRHHKQIQQLNKNSQLQTEQIHDNNSLDSEKQEQKQQENENKQQETNQNIKDLNINENQQQNQQNEQQQLQQNKCKSGEQLIYLQQKPNQQQY